MSVAADVNLLAAFLSNEQISNLEQCQPVDCIVLCGSQLLLQAEKLFEALERNPSLTKVLLMVGGIGHSTQALYNAVASSTRYRAIAQDVNGLPESLVYDRILTAFFDRDRIESCGCKVMIEDGSTNCGSNAIEARRVLMASDVPPIRTLLLVQDPTMMLRTSAAFRKSYGIDPASPKLLCCPLFVPRVQDGHAGIEFVEDEVMASQLWPRQRFIDLLLGEIPRLRNDARGYGPNGKGFIAHVEIPNDIETAHARLSERLSSSRCADD